MTAPRARLTARLGLAGSMSSIGIAPSSTSVYGAAVSQGRHLKRQQFWPGGIAVDKQAADQAHAPALWSR